MYEAIIDEWSMLPIEENGFADGQGTPTHSCVDDAFDVQVYASERV
jgi:hypothetical protein